MTGDRSYGPETAGADRDDRGRFRSGAANRGRPRGARNRVTRAVEALIEGEAEALAREAIRLALAGDGPLLRALLDRLAPPPKDRPVRFAMPALRTLADAPEAGAAVLKAVAAGALSPADARAVGELIATFTRSAEAAALDARVAELERRLAAR